MRAGDEHLLPISSPLTSVQMDTRCTKAGADAARSMVVTRLGRDWGCPEKELLLLDTAQRGWGSRVPRTAHRKIHLHPAMLGMWKLQRAQKHLLIVTTELPSARFPVKSRLPALFALLVWRLPAEPRGFRGALRCFGHLWQSISYKSPPPAPKPPACCHSSGKLFQIC